LAYFVSKSPNVKIVFHVKGHDVFHCAPIFTITRKIAPKMRLFGVVSC
jgi:hypothetical protein